MVTGMKPAARVLLIAGREAIRAVHRRNQAADPNKISFSEVRIDAAEDRAVMLWSWTSEIAPQGRAPVVTKGALAGPLEAAVGRLADQR
jgi:hypothetical protein